MRGILKKSQALYKTPYHDSKGFENFIGSHKVAVFCQLLNVKKVQYRVMWSVSDKIVASILPLTINRF